MQFPYMEVRHFSLPYAWLAWLYMEVRHQNILQQGGNESGLQMLISFVWNIVTLKGIIIFAYFFMLYNISKVSFLCRNPFKSQKCCPQKLKKSLFSKQKEGGGGTHVITMFFFSCKESINSIFTSRRESN